MFRRSIVCGCIGLFLWTPSMAQMSPEEAMKFLDRPKEEAGNSDREERDGPAAYSEYHWRVYATRISRFFYQFDGEYHCNTYYSPRWSRVSRRYMGERPTTTRRSTEIPVGVFHDTSMGQKHPVTETYRYELEDAEVFAREQALGVPEAGNFGFIRAAKVSRVIDEDTLELAEIQLVDAACEDQFNDSTQHAASWAMEMYTELQIKAAHCRKRIDRDDRFISAYPNTSELTKLQVAVVEEQFEGRLAMLEAQERWHRLKLVIHGVDAARYERNKLETWDDSETQFILTDRRGDTLYAITPQLARRSQISRDDLLKHVKARGYEPGRFIELVDELQKRRNPDHSTWRRAALVLAGRPLKDDALLAREFHGPADRQ